MSDFPKSFQLGGMTIKVKIDPTLRTTCNALGMAQYDRAQMLLDVGEYPEDVQWITFYHELMHFIFHTMGRDDLRSDETLVDSVGNLLWQAHKTMKF